MWIWFTLTPIVPALFFLFTKKHVGATIAALVVIPFYAMAYYSDCVLPYQGGGASMVYVIVIMVGTPTALAAGFIANFVANKIASSSAD